MCRIDYAADDWVLLTDEHRKARKEHQCTDCRRTILRGETYRHIVGVSDRHMYPSNMCAHCEKAAGWLMDICGGYLFDGVGEELQEHWDEETDFRCRTLALLCSGHRRAWQGVPVKKVEDWTRYAAAYATRQINRVASLREGTVTG